MSKRIAYNVVLYLIGILIFVYHVQAINITVCASGCNYTTIQEAVYGALLGDTIDVLNGSYNENITVNVSVMIKGVPYILVTGGFNVSKSNVTIEWFNITSGVVLDRGGLAGSYRT